MSKYNEFDNNSNSGLVILLSIFIAPLSIVSIYAFSLQVETPSLTQMEAWIMAVDKIVFFFYNLGQNVKP